MPMLLLLCRCPRLCCLAGTRQAADMAEHLERRIAIIEKFVEARKLLKKEPVTMVGICKVNPLPALPAHLLLRMTDMTNTRCLSVCLSVCLHVCLTVCLSVCLTVCMSV